MEGQQVIDFNVYGRKHVPLLFRFKFLSTFSWVKPVWNKRFHTTNDVQIRQKLIPIQFRFHANDVQFNPNSKSHPRKYWFNSIPSCNFSLQFNSDSTIPENPQNMIPIPIPELELHILVQNHEDIFQNDAHRITRLMHINYVPVGWKYLFALGLKIIMFVFLVGIKTAGKLTSEINIL